ncbi:MAG: hypothetical protein JKY65_13540 [Planctomycetes bacterium]|nr:hypothetical protein [Planctomycetota bacterium]
MADSHIGTVSVPITQPDKDQIADVLESCPFPQDTLLKLALRIGLDTIKKDPSVLMPYIAKKG